MSKACALPFHKHVRLPGPVYINPPSPCPSAPLLFNLHPRTITFYLSSTHQPTTLHIIYRPAIHLIFSSHHNTRTRYNALTNDAHHNMDGADKAHDAPETSATTDVPVINPPPQRFAPTAVMQSPQSPNTTVLPMISSIGNAVPTKRKASEPPVSRDNGSSTTYPMSPRSSVEPSHEENGFMTTPPTTDSKKRKSKDEASTVRLGKSLSLCQQVEQLKYELKKDDIKHADQAKNEPYKPAKTKGYKDRGERTASGLAIDQPEFDIYRQVFPLIARYLEDKVQEIRTRFGALKDGEVEAILSKCVEYAETKTTMELMNIIVWGPAGNGKSTILRCLLNDRNAVLARSSGQSSTNVKHQYFFTEKSQDEPYRAVVEFRSETELRSIVEHQVDKIFAYQHQISPDEDDRKPQDVDQIKLAKKELKSSLDVLAGFTVRPGVIPGDLGFDSPTALEIFVGDKRFRESAIKEEVVQCAKATLELHRTEGGEFTSKSLSGLLNACLKYSSPIKGQPLAPWMLVKQISIGIPAFVLENSVGFADVPGILDTNHIRRLAANDAFDSCSVVILVHNYSRAADSTLMEESLRKCVSADKNVILVVTHIEIAAKDGDKFWGDTEEEDELMLGDELTDPALQQLMCELRKTKGDLAQAEDADDDDETDRETVKGLRTQCSELKSRIYKRRLVVKRTFIVKQLQEQHAELQLHFNGRADKQLSVHCTCGPEYEIHMKGYEGNEAPELSVEETEVPELRKGIRSQRANMMVQRLEDAINRNGLGRVLNAFEYYCDRSTLELGSLVKQFVIEPKDEFTSQCDKLSTKLGRDVETIMEAAENHAREVSKKHGKALHEEWAELRPSTYRAFCEKGGEHRLRDGENLMMVSWNEKIVARLKDLITTTFKNILQKVNFGKAELLRRVDGFLNHIVTNMKGMEQYPSARIRCG